MAVTINTYNNLPAIDMPTRYVNVNSGPENPYYAVKQTVLKGLSGDAITGPGTTTITVNMPLGANATVMLTSTNINCTVALQSQSTSGFVVIASSGTTATPTFNAIVFDPA